MSAKASPVSQTTRRSSIRRGIGILVLVLLAAAAAWATTATLYWERTASGLRYRVVEQGEGPNPGPADVAMINYTGRLLDGTVFDSNAGQPPAELPVSGVVPGFSEALQMMNKGATYRVRIPPELGYGDRPPPTSPIPPNATLEFDITLVDTRPLSAQEMQQMQMMQQMQQMQEQGGPPPGGEGPQPGTGPGEGAPERR